MKRVVTTVVALVLAIGVLSSDRAGAEEGLGLLEQLGKSIFFDPNLSVNGTQSCASCHDPLVGFTGPNSTVNDLGAVERGALPDRFGNRKPPTAAYAGASPVLYYDEGKDQWVGGMFWDGRATGWQLGDPLAEQAQGPFVNPLEQAMSHPKQVCLRVAHSSYARLFREVWGAAALDCVKDAEGAYERIARSVAAYERSAEVSSFSSKFDVFWKSAKNAGKDATRINFGNNRDPYRWQNYRGLGLADAELQGLAAFNDSARGDCSRCHSLGSSMDELPLFTDNSYWNIGIPKNPENPFYSMPKKWNPDGFDWVDYGLGGFLATRFPVDVYVLELGKFKTPTLRNVDLRPSTDFVKAYGHNGFFKSLEEIILFYTWRAHMRMMAEGECGGGMGGGGMGGGGMGGGGMGGGGMGGGGMGGGGMGEGGMGEGGMGEGGGMMPDPNLFPPPEYAANLEPLRFTCGMPSMMDQANILAFLKTLSDGYEPVE
jgi:cytochrome c peroxidase